MKKRFTILTLIPIILFSSGCSVKTVPSKGYESIKTYNSVLFVAHGLTGTELKYTSCDYVWLQKDGREKLENLKNAVYYRVASYVMDGTTKRDFLDYYVYYGEDERLQTFDESSEGLKLYTYAYALVKDGTFIGKIGTL